MKAIYNQQLQLYYKEQLTYEQSVPSALGGNIKAFKEIILVNPKSFWDMFQFEGAD